MSEARSEHRWTPAPVQIERLPMGEWRLFAEYGREHIGVAVQAEVDPSDYVAEFRSREGLSEARIRDIRQDLVVTMNEVRQFRIGGGIGFDSDGSGK